MSSILSNLYKIYCIMKEKGQEIQYSTNETDWSAVAAHGGSEYEN